MGCMRRIVAISFAVGWLLDVPTLCVSGLITHACECVDVLASPCDPGCGHEAGCHHENGCSDDPCSTPVVRNQRPRDGVDTTPPSPVPCVAFNTGPRSDQTIRSEGRTSSRPQGLPFPPSDIPLLI